METCISTNSRMCNLVKQINACVFTEREGFLSDDISLTSGPFLPLYLSLEIDKYIFAHNHNCAVVNSLFDHARKSSDYEQFSVKNQLVSSAFFYISHILQFIHSSRTTSFILICIRGRVQFEVQGSDYETNVCIGDGEMISLFNNNSIKHIINVISPSSHIIWELVGYFTYITILISYNFSNDIVDHIWHCHFTVHVPLGIRK